MSLFDVCNNLKKSVTLKKKKSCFFCCIIGGQEEEGIVAFLFGAVRRLLLLQSRPSLTNMPLTVSPISHRTHSSSVLSCAVAAVRMVVAPW